nr:hypothetical protein [Tanacetum cinerariifolium]
MDSRNITTTKMEITEKMINMDTMKITATKVEVTGRNKDDPSGYKNDHKHYKKSDGGFNQKIDQEDLKTYTAAFVIRGRMLGQNPINRINPKPAGKPNRSQTGQTQSSANVTFALRPTEDALSAAGLIVRLPVLMRILHSS